MSNLREDRLLEESFALSRRLEAALERDPELLREVPAGAKIVLVSEANPELAEYGQAVAERISQPNDPVFFLLVDSLPA